MKMTERTAKWMKTVADNCEAKTGRALPDWLALARKAKLQTAQETQAWARNEGLSIVYQSAVVDGLFPATNDDAALLDAQFAGPKAALRPVYEAVTKAARKLGPDVEVMPRKSQVTFTRGTSFAVVRAATRDRLDVALKLRGEKPTKRLVAVAKAMGSDPTHVVAVKRVSDVDPELIAWLNQAYRRAKA